MAFLDLTGGLPRSILDRLRPLLNGRERVALIAAVALLATGIIVAILWTSGPRYSVLFAGLSGEEGGRTVAELQKLNIPYQITDELLQRSVRKLGVDAQSNQRTRD